MKYFAKKTAVYVMTVATALVLLFVPAMAESVEKPWAKDNVDPSATRSKPTGFLNSILPSKTKTRKPAPITAVGPGSTGATALSKNKRPVKVRKKKRVKQLTVQPAKKTSNKEAHWWENVGNPAVFSFRDCSSRYAIQQVAKDRDVPAVNLITTAMKTSCQTEFKKMAATMIGFLGEKKSNAMLAELAKTTFLPTVKAAVIDEKQKQIARKASAQTARTQKHTSEKNLQTAKTAMFQCFAEKSDRLSAAKSTQANTIADSVLIGCQNRADAFFDLLLENSKASSEVKNQQKSIALNETYRMAIIKRILATRKNAAVSTAAGETQ